MLIKIRELFWPEISALGVFLNFDNKPPPYLSAPPLGPGCCRVGMQVPLFLGKETWPLDLISTEEQLCYPFLIKFLNFFYLAQG